MHDLYVYNPPFVESAQLEGDIVPRVPADFPREAGDVPVPACQQHLATAGRLG